MFAGGADVDEAAEVQSIKTRVVKLPTKDAAKSLFQLTVCIYQAEELAMIKGVLSTNCNPFVQELPRIIDAELISTQPEPEGHGFVWKGKENIRMDHMVPTFSLPAPENCGEFIISVFAKFKKTGLLGGKKPERHMYARVPASSAGFLLMTLCLGPDSPKPPARAKPLKIKWKDYCFRAKIYQAVNLPAKDTADFDIMQFKTMTSLEELQLKEEDRQDAFLGLSKC
eukprot:g31769.t1